MTTVKYVVLTGTVYWLVLNCGCTKPPEHSLAPDQQLDVPDLTGRLAAPSRSAQAKLEAAQLLLTSRRGEVVSQLRNFLAANDNRPAQIAVAKAIAGSAGGSEEFVAPLMAMLTGDEQSVRAPAASALVTYGSGGVRKQLIAVARDVRVARPTRLVVIAALPGVLDKEAVDALIGLLDDEDPAVSQAAATSLAKLTNIRTFAADRDQWKRWWRLNKDKDRSQWLADLAEKLARAKDAIEDDNARLRERLIKAMEDIYAVAAASRREMLLLAFVTDTLADIRLVGVEITARRLSAGEKVSPELALQILGAVSDGDPRVRREAALLAASLGNKRTLKLLLDRLDSEKIRNVRQGLLTAIGRLRDPKALSAVLKGIGDDDAGVATAAAAALAAIASKQPLPDNLRPVAATALVEKYHKNATIANGAPLREALLTAMGAVKDMAVTGVLREALKDPDATVRLAAVNGMAQFGAPSLAGPLVVLTSDEDRGVRQAVIAALGALDGKKHLKRILDRTLPGVEEDAGVRAQAWEVAMKVLSDGDAEALWSVSESIGYREDSPQQRIKIAQMLVDRLARDKDGRLPLAQRRLASALLKIARPAEAAAQLSKAWATLRKTKKPEAAACWLEWVEALLAAGDAMVVKVLSDEKETSAFASAYSRLEAGLGNLVAGGRYDQATEIALGAIGTLGKRLSKEQKDRVSRILNDAKTRQALADRLKVGKLVLQLLASDAAAAKAASAALKGMGDRAVAGLVEELNAVVAAEKPNLPAEEGKILEIVVQVAPRLSDYDPKATKADRLKVIAEWRKTLISSSASVPGE